MYQQLSKSKERAEIGESISNGKRNRQLSIWQENAKMKAS